MYTTVILILPIILVIMANILSLLGKRAKDVRQDANLLFLPSLSVIVTKLIIGHNLLASILIYATCIMLIGLLINIIVYNGIPFIEDDIDDLMS